MKRQFLLLVAIAVFATALTTNASAQPGKTVRTNVAFDFQIGDRIYPAGEYWIETFSWHDNVLRIRNVRDTNKTAFFLANHAKSAKGQTPRFVFHKCGEDYFLSEIFLDTQPWGYSIRPSHLQRESEKHLASRIPRKN